MAGSIVSDDRFIVVAVSGYTVNPSAGRSGSSSRKAPVSYSVLDTAYAYREVGQFHIVSSRDNTPTQRRAANRLCDELNKRDREFMAQENAA